MQKRYTIELLHKILFVAEEITSSGKKKFENWLTFDQKTTQQNVQTKKALFL
jgi:hypothetical protein